MLKIKKISEVIGKHVYTADGDYFGQVEEVNLADNKVDGWRIRIGSGFMSNLGGARGVIIPHGFVKSIGDVFVINSAAFKSNGPALAEGIETTSGASSDSIDLA